MTTTRSEQIEKEAERQHRMIDDQLALKWEYIAAFKLGATWADSTSPLKAELERLQRVEKVAKVIVGLLVHTDSHQTDLMKGPVEQFYKHTNEKR